MDTCTVGCCMRDNPRFSLQQCILDKSLHKIAIVIPSAVVKQSANIHEPRVYGLDAFLAPRPQHRDRHIDHQI